MVKVNPAGDVVRVGAVQCPGCGRHNKYGRHKHYGDHEFQRQKCIEGVVDVGVDSVVVDRLQGQ